MASPQKAFKCSNCGQVTAKWAGQCPSCNEWNTLEEDSTAGLRSAAVQAPSKISARATRAATGNSPRPMSQIGSNEYARLKSGLSELDRVLGGGFVPGGVILLAGSPGAGKSSLTTEIAKSLTSLDKTVLIISGEETESQIAARAKRLGVTSDKLLLLSENNLTNALAHAEAIKPDLLVVDSIQTLVSDNSEGRTGSVTQVAEVSTEIVGLAKALSIPTILIGHVTKSGEVGGPQTLAHLVDVVLYLESTNDSPVRLLRGDKNRYGATDELGIFEHTSNGLEQVSDPSGFFLTVHEPGTVGFATTIILEGNRALPAEIQALVADSTLPNARKINHGIEHTRSLMVQAIAEKHARVRLADRDVYVSTAGGITVKDSSIDLAVAAAIISSAKNIAISDKTIFLGETSLTGEIRPAKGMRQRAKEARRLGFTEIVSPSEDKEPGQVTVRNMGDLVSYLAKLEKSNPAT